jgi:hypothetical protein
MAGRRFQLAGAWNLRLAFGGARQEDDGDSLRLFHLDYCYSLNKR